MFDASALGVCQIIKDKSRLIDMLSDATQILHANQGLLLSDDQQIQLLKYLDQLLFWNQAYNLTAIKDPRQALLKHIIDCLAAVPHLDQGTLLDIGTGAGLPAVVVAICQPERSVTALDSNRKKIRFIKQVTCELKLSNVTAIASRIEQFKGTDFDVVTSRAFASLSDFVGHALPCVSKTGSLQTMKGLVPTQKDMDDVMAVLNRTGHSSWQLNIVPLTVPQLNETRHLVSISAK